MCILTHTTALQCQCWKLAQTGNRIVQTGDRIVNKGLLSANR